MRTAVALVVVLLTASESYAARLFTTGFEENNLTATMWTSAGAGAAVSSTAPHAGTYHLRLSGTTAKNVVRQLPANATSGTYYTRFYFKASNVSAVTSEFFRIRNVSSASALILSKLTTGAIRLTNNVSATTATSTMTLSVDTWYRFEVEYVVADAGGSMVVRMYVGDSTTISETLTISGEDTLNTNVREWMWTESQGNASTTYDIDDIAINDNSGTVQTSWTGPGSIYLLVPNAEVSTSYTPLSGTDNSLMVDDLPGSPDDDTTYNSHGTANAEDRLGLTNLGAEVGAGDTIVLVDVYGRIRGDTTAGTHQMRVLIWDEGGTQTNGPTTTLNDSTAYALMSTSDHLVLDTTGKTKSNVDSFDVGYESVTTSNTFVTAIWVNVEWRAAAASPTSKGLLMGVLP